MKEAAGCRQACLKSLHFVNSNRIFFPLSENKLIYKNINACQGGERMINKRCAVGLWWSHRRSLNSGPSRQTFQSPHPIASKNE